jgi:fatty acid desaturase
VQSTTPTQEAPQPRPLADGPLEAEPTGARPAVDLEAFARDVEALRAELTQNLGPADARHLEKLQRWGRAATALGYATAWVAPNPVSAALLALGTGTRWMVVAHHVSHKGMDRVPTAPANFHSRVFARGRRRLVDWLDWLDPEAWDHEHNALHHYRTGELADPDLVEHHLEPVRNADIPHALKLGAVAFWALTWRLTYYAPNTYQVLLRRNRDREARRASAKPFASETDATATATAARGVDRNAPRSDDGEPHLFSAFDPRTAEGRAFLATIAPYALARFVLAPAAFLPLGPLASASVLANTAMAELLTNLHTFCVIAPNHAGPDVVRFDTPPDGRAEHLARQVLGSVNFTGGSDWADFLQGYLNYQIEHHLFPELPPLKLREAQPKVEALCKKHGIPYVREGVHRRVAHLVDIMTGRSSMIRAKNAREALAAMG